jgi:ribosomal protein S18 acetylase RimI-like enzyme
MASLTYSLRQADDGDYDFLYELHRLALREYIEPIWGWHEEWQQEYFRAKFDPRKRQIIVVEGQDAGVVVVENRPEELYLGLIELLPRFQRRGLGAAIVNQLKAEAEATNRPLTLDVLKTNHPARRLYEQLGLGVVADEEHRHRMSYPPAATETPGLIQRPVKQ